MSEGGSALVKGCIVAGFLGGVLTVIAASAVYLLGAGPAPGPAAAPVASPPAAPTAAPTAAGTPTAAGAPVASGAAVARIQQRGRLLVAMDTGEPPMSGTPPMFFVDAQGGRDGFDYALARRVADTLGVAEVEIVHVPYSGLEAALVDPSGKVDLVISGYSPTEVAGVSWSAPYLEYGLCLVVTDKSPVQTTADLVGKRVGIFDDDAAAEEVRTLVKGYRSLTRMENGYWEALLAGDFDGFLYDYPYAAAELQKFTTDHPDKRGAFRIAQYNLTDSTYAVGARSADTDLLAAVDDTITRWRASPDYAAAVKRYLKGGEATRVVDTTARTVTVARGDTLSGIAQRELGASERWREVWDLNRSRFPNPHLIEVGDQVILPAR